MARKKYTPEFWEKNFPRLMELIVQDGMTLKDAATLMDIKLGEFFKLIYANEDYRIMYDKASQCRAEVMASEIMSIADDASHDYITDEQGNRIANKELVARTRIRVESRKWLMSKLYPRRFGDRIDVTSSDGTAKPSVNISIDGNGIDLSK